MRKIIGKLQRVPVEEITRENRNQQYRLSVEDYYNPKSGKITSVAISNRDEHDFVVHDIEIKGSDGLISRTLVALTHILEDMLSKITSWESTMMQELEKMEKDGKIVVRGTSNPFSRETLKEIGLENSLPEYNLTVRMSRLPDQDIFFIIKGTEKEDNATKPPFKMDVENGDFVSVSKENLRPFIEELKVISGMSS